MADTTTPSKGARPARDPFRFLMSLAVKNEVARYRAGSEPAYLVNNPHYIKHVLADNAANYSKETAINSSFKEAVADGLLTSEGTNWRRQRRMTQPAFHRERLYAVGAWMTEATRDMLERWDSAAASGRTLDVTEEMGALTLRITVRALFGADVAEEADTLGNQFGGAIPVLVAPDKPAFKLAKASIEDLVGRIVEERRREPGAAQDLLAMLLEARDEETGEGMTDRQLRDQIITLVVAGYETTANALAWTWYLLSRNPGARERLEEELRAVLGGRAPTMVDLPILSYNRMVLEESLRLYPPAWILGRRALSDDSLGEHVIPAGSVVALSPYTMHRHPSWWDRPEEFDPERFTPERSAGQHPFQYFPFGGGPRLCIGHNFAMIEAQLIIATVAQRYRLELVPGYSVEPERRFVLRPRGGLPMTLAPAS